MDRGIGEEMQAHLGSRSICFEACDLICQNKVSLCSPIHWRKQCTPAGNCNKARALAWWLRELSSSSNAFLAASTACCASSARWILISLTFSSQMRKPVERALLIMRLTTRSTTPGMTPQQEYSTIEKRRGGGRGGRGTEGVKEGVILSGRGRRTTGSTNRRKRQRRRLWRRAKGHDLVAVAPPPLPL